LEDEGTTKDQGVYVVPAPKGYLNQGQFGKKELGW
jgi:hypothetical protein